MATLPFGITKVIVGFSDLFSKRAWPLVPVLLAGAIVAVGPRTVAAVLRVMGMVIERQFQQYHRMLNRIQWSPLATGRRLLCMLIAVFVPQSPPAHGPGRHDRTAARTQDCRQGNLPRSGAIESHSFRQGQWLALAVLDVTGANPLGPAPLVIAVLFGTGAVGALLLGPPPAPQQVHRSCTSITADDPALAAKSVCCRCRQQFCGIETACRRARHSVHRHPPAPQCRPVRSCACSGIRHEGTITTERSPPTNVHPDTRFRHHALA